MKQKNESAAGQARADRLKKAKYVCRVDYPSYWKFFKNPDRLFDLQKKQDKYDFITRYEAEHSQEEIFTSKDLAELQKLERDCLDFLLQKDVKTYFKGCGEFGKGSLSEIREAYLPHLTEEQVRRMASAIWANFETIPNALREFTKIEKCEYETWRKEIFNKLTSVFEEFESDLEIHLPLDLIRSVMGTNDCRLFPPEYLTFLLHHFSLMNNELLSTGVAPLRHRIKKHEVLSTELVLVTQQTVDHEKRFEKYCLKLLAILDKRLPAYKPITSLDQMCIKKCAEHGVFARTEDGVLSFDWVRPAIEQLKSLLYRDIDRDLELEDLLTKFAEQNQKKKQAGSHKPTNISMIPEDDIEDITQTAKQDDERVEDRPEEPESKPKKTTSKIAAAGNGEKKPRKRKPRGTKMDEENGKRPSLFDFGIQLNPAPSSESLTQAKLDVEAPPPTKQQTASSSQMAKKLSHKDHPDAVDLEPAGAHRSSSLAAVARPVKRSIQPDNQK